MAYQKQTWRDYDDTKTELQNVNSGAVVTPERLNHIENGIANSADKAEVTTQLQQKITKGNVSVADINKNLGKFDQTYMSDDFLQQITGDTPINAVPAKASITQEYLATKAINEYHTDFLTVGKNLIDKERLIYGTIGNDGGLVASESYRRPTYFIEVTGETNYIANQETTFAWYDSAYNFIRRDFIVVSGTPVLSPPNAKYLMVSFFGGYREIYQLEIGTVTTAYEAYKFVANKLTVELNQLGNGKRINQRQLGTDSVTQVELTNVVTGKNLFNPDDVLPNVLLRESDGENTTNSAYVTSKNFFTVEGSSSYIDNDISSIVVFYDESLKFISSVSNLVTGEPKGVISTPSNARYAKISTISGAEEKYQFEKGSVMTPLEGYETVFETQKLIEGNFKDGTVPLSALKGATVGKNLFDKEAVINGRVSMTAGDVVSTDLFKTSDYIPISDSTRYVQNSATFFAFYDEFKIFIPTIYTQADVSFESPINAKYIRVSPRITDVESYQLEKGYTSSNYEKFGYNLDGILGVSTIEGAFTKELKYPSPPRTVPEIYRKSTTISITDVDVDGTLWGVRWDNVIYKSFNGFDWILVFDLKPLLNEGETCSLYCTIVSDTGRIISCTSDGRVFVSNEDQTAFEEAFTYDAGFTAINFGYDKQQNVILLSTYVLNKSETNRGREVILSTDYGATWKQVFLKDPAEMLDPKEYHIHDVAYDPYSNMIIVSIGDLANRNILYSYNHGESWEAMFDESEYGLNKIAPIHPTSFLVFPEGIAMGSDELPEGIYWWERPQGILKPKLKYSDISYKINFSGEADTVIGTFAHKGDTLQNASGMYGVMPFRNHLTNTQGNSRLFATGDGGRSWHEIYRDESDDSLHKGFFNAVLKEDADGIYVYGTYSQLDDQYMFKAKLPDFYKI